VTLEPNGIATVRYEPAKAGCIRLLAVESCPCSSCFAHRAFRLCLLAFITGTSSLEPWLEFERRMHSVVVMVMRDRKRRARVLLEVAEASCFSNT